MEMNNDLNLYTEIPKSEQESFSQLIKDFRKKIIKTPSEHVESVFLLERNRLDSLVRDGNISEAISIIREQAFNEFLKDESRFNMHIISSLCDKLETPANIFKTVISSNLIALNKEEVIPTIKKICGEYAGSISPYIYQISLSNTQSRRSRAGKTFESIIYKFYEVFEYEFVSQKKIGKETFKEKGLGKMVDSLLPNINAFEQRRDKVIIGTMKTTLRERWQEVVEEVSRTGLPKIYLLTVDEDISESKANQMGKHNIVLVVLKSVKNDIKLRSYRNIISFEEYFMEEIPEILNYWNEV